MDNILYTLNHTYSQLNLNMTSSETYIRTKPSLVHMNPFDCKVYTHIFHHLYSKLNLKTHIRFFFFIIQILLKDIGFWDLQSQKSL